MQLAETKTLKQDVLQAQREACQKTQQATLSSCGGPELREEVIGELVGVQLIHCLADQSRSSALCICFIHVS